MYYIRSYRSKLLSLIKFFPVVSLCGARQTGKTTLLKDTFPDYNYVSLDLPSTAEMAEKNPEDFFKLYKAPLIIDEVQYAPAVFRHLKSLVDSERHLMGQYILTGSQKFNLMKEVSDSLAGRAVILDLENLSLSELFHNKDRRTMSFNIADVMLRGQYPELWRMPDLPEKAFYNSYIATYLERDVRQILNVVSLRDFERFVRVLAPRSGQLLNKTEIARDVGVSVKAINDWLSVLQASNLIVFLEPWFQNISKRIVKTPKFYFCDSGLLCFLLGVDSQNFAESPFKGQIWETYVFSEIRKKNQCEDNPVTFWFYRDQMAREIDFIIERGGYISFAECKWTANPDKDDLKHINAIHKEMKNKDLTYKAGKHYVICNTPDFYSLNEDTEALGLDNIQRIFKPEAI